MKATLGSVALLFMIAASTLADDPRAEFRAGWVTRFDWPDADAERCKANIGQVFETAAAAHLNAVVFQVRGEADTLYPSTIEPWSELIGCKDPGFDPLALAIEQAHQRGIQLHAYINAMPLRSTRPGGPPPDRSHLWYAHGPGSPEPWVCLDEQGRPTQEEYTYLSPAIPEVHAYLRRAIMDVVTRYDVDGIHLDRVRYPGPQYIHDRSSERRFYGRGNPNLRGRADWQREQLDKFINDLAAEIRAIKPACVLSCSAWGIYNRHHIAGYDGFSSGYHEYYQDTWNWCRLGAMDLLMPMIYWNMPDPKPNYHELLKDFVDGVGGDRVVGGQRIFSPEENVAEVRAGREMGAAGAVFFTLGRADRRGVLGALKETLYASRVPVPTALRVAAPTHGDVLGTVTIDGSAPLVDAWVSLVADEGGERRGNRPRGDVFSRTWTSGSDGRFAFLNVPPGPVKVRVLYAGADPVESEPLEVQAGRVATVRVSVPQAAGLRELPFVQVLGRTSPGIRVEVGGAPARVFSTGAFVRDAIPLVPGENRIRIVAKDESGRSSTHDLVVVRREPSVASQPAKATAERPRRGGRGSRAASESAPADERTGSRVGEANEDGVGITFGLHTVRLGGPWLARVPRGTRFEVVERREGHVKVALSRSLSGWVSAGQVSLLPADTAAPHNYFTSCEVSGDEQYDIVSIPLREKVVFAIHSETEPTNRICVDLFNTHDALTWISHKSGARIVGPVTGEQVEDDRFRLTLPVRTRQIWGYWAEMDGNTLRIRVRRPPAIAAAPESPLKGLLFALEAGHGGSGTGAMGHMGTKEKTVNAAAVQALEAVLKQRGARTVQVRPGDSSPTLQERVEATNAAGADFFVSIHANAAGNGRGYLAISGTSTYYKDKHCYRPADLVYRRLLQLEWPEFGVVGNFSYHPLTNTRTPGILVEQAFMSNPYDEARLLDPDYQRQQAEAIAAGLEEFFAAARE